VNGNGPGLESDVSVMCTRIEQNWMSWLLKPFATMSTPWLL
jgi:hypothetical protein